MAVAASLSFAAVAAAGFELVSTRSALALSLDLASRSTRNWGASPFSLWQLVLQLSLCYLPHRQQSAKQPGRQPRWHFPATVAKFVHVACLLLAQVKVKRSRCTSLSLLLSLLLILSVFLSVFPSLPVSLSPVPVTNNSCQTLLPKIQVARCTRIGSS